MLRRSVLALALTAGWLGFAGPAGAATLEVCPSGCTYTSVQAAVTAASAGDTIDVGAGTYTEFGIVIDKPLTIKGAGDSTILDGGGGSIGSTPGIFRILPGVDSKGEGAITISDMLLRNTSKNTSASTYFAVSIGVKQLTTGITGITLDELTIEGTNDSAKPDYGVYADSGFSAANPVDREAPPLTITNSEISGTRYNNIGVDSWVGTVDITNNQLHESTGGSSALLVFNEYTPNQITPQVTIQNNTSTGRLIYIRNIDFNATLASRGGFKNVSITDNEITGLAGTDAGILVSTNSPDGAPPTRMGTVDVMDNSIRGDGTSTGTTGVQISGYVEDATIDDNNIVGVGNGIGVATIKNQNPVAVSAQHNRLFANLNGLSNSSSADVAATENWWGCQDGPASASTYCSTALNTGGGSIDTSTWVVTTASLGASSVPTNGTTDVDTNLATLNTGDAVTLPSFFTGLAAAFDADSGSVDPGSTTLDGNQAASGTYTAPGTAGSDVVTVTLDREEFPGAPEAQGASAASYAAPVITGEPVELPLTVTAVITPDPDDDGDDDDTDGDDDGAVGGGGSDRDGTLPDTGSDVSSWQLALAIMMIALGTALATMAGRRSPTVGRHRLA